MKTEVNLVLCAVVLLTCGSHLEEPAPLSTSTPVTGTLVPQSTMRPNQNLSFSNSSASDEDLMASNSSVRNNSAPGGSGVPVSGGPVSNDNDSTDVGLLASVSPISNNHTPCAGGPSASDCPIKNNSTPGGGGVPVSGDPVSNDNDSSDVGLLASVSSISNNSAPGGGSPSASNMNESDGSSTSRAPTSAPTSPLHYSVTHNATSTSDSLASVPSTLRSTTLTRGVHPAVSTLPASTHLSTASPHPASAPQPTPRSSEPSPSLYTQTQVPQDRPSQLNVKDEEEDPHQSELPLDPLLAGLVSVFILTAAVITLLLFLKFRRRNIQPEFRRLQDLPMDDMMEDAPLSMYSY